MQDWLNSMSPRERIMVIGCVVFVSLALLWALGLRPLLNHADGLEERVIGKRAQLAGLQEQAALIDSTRASNGQPATAGNQSLVVIIDRTTRERQLAGYLKRNQPEGATSVRLRLEGAPFDDLVNWLGDLERLYGLKIANANFDRADIGRVNATLTLSRSGA